MPIVMVRKYAALTPVVSVDAVVYLSRERKSAPMKAFELCQQHREAEADKLVNMARKALDSFIAEPPGARPKAHDYLELFDRIRLFLSLVVDNGHALMAVPICPASECVACRDEVQR